MKSRKIAHRESAHHERGFQPRMSAHQSHGSPASRDTRIGTGEKPGAGEVEMPSNGPGRAASRKIGLPQEATGNQGSASGSKPSGMSTYREE